jgi:hypothetical protein
MVCSHVVPAVLEHMNGLLPTDIVFGLASSSANLAPQLLL